MLFRSPPPPLSPAGAPIRSSEAAGPLGVRDTLLPSLHLFPELLLLLLQPLLDLLNGCLLPLHLPLVEACQVLPTAKRQDRQSGHKERRAHSRKRGEKKLILHSPCAKHHSKNVNVLTHVILTACILGGYCCSVAQSRLTLCDPMDCSMPCPSLSPGVCSNSDPLSR